MAAYLNSDYNDKVEAPFGTQLKQMLDYDGEDAYWELWGGDDGYAVSKPAYQIYNSKDNDESKVIDIFGVTLDDLKAVIVDRNGTAYRLTEEHYEKRTGHAFPSDLGLSAINVLCLSPQDVRDRISALRMVREINILK